MSAATADRLLRSQRKGGQCGLSTTRAGTLLKQQIPIRTFEEWKETRPGFLEASIRVFSVDDCTVGKLPKEGNAPNPTAGLEALYREQERRKRVLGWRRTHKDPFEGEWEQILSWLVANPERSSGDIFRELQRRSPGRYQPLQIRTLQRGMRKIRTSLLETAEEQWQEEVIHGRSSPPISPAARATGSS
jgi:hypothetical protein